MEVGTDWAALKNKGCAPSKFISNKYVPGTFHYTETAEPDKASEFKPRKIEKVHTRREELPSGKFTGRDRGRASDGKIIRFERQGG